MERIMPCQINAKRSDINPVKQQIKNILEDEDKGIGDLREYLVKIKDKVKLEVVLNSPLENTKGLLAIHYIWKEGEDSVEAVEMLEQFGADIHKEDLGGRSILHVAWTRNWINIVKYWLNRGMDINLKNPNSGTIPLSIAVMNGHFELTKYLLEQGADFLYENNKKKIVDIAHDQSKQEVTDIIDLYVTRDNNWKNRRALLKMFVNRTPISKLRIYLFRKIALYA